ncbi:MAG: excinuclease ABC subunit UvrC, partial [Acidimicrobiales bacterium]
MVGPRSEDVDLIAVHDDELEAAVQVFFVRKGRVLGRRGFIIDKAEELDRSEVMSRALERLYFEPNPMGDPKKVLVSDLPANLALYEEWLSEARGSKVDIAVPHRGDKRELMATDAKNAG